MNDLDLIKKVKGAAPLDSPEFTGVPKVPTASDNASDTQIANAQFVSNRVAAVQEVITSDIDALKVKVDKITDTGIDTDALKEEIKNELKNSLSDKIIKELGNQSVEIAYTDIESKQKAVIEQIDNTLDLLNTTITDLGSKSVSLTIYKTTLENHKATLVTKYNEAKAAYDICCTNNTTDNYIDFKTKLDAWNEYTGTVLSYCQIVLNALSKALDGIKADATQEAIFNLLTNNGEAQGLYYADVEGEDGTTTRQLFISGEYAQLYGTKIKDFNGDVTFEVTKSGQVNIKANSFTLQGKSISDTVTSEVNSALSETNEKISNLETNKADNTNQAIMKALTNDGKIKGIFMGEVEDENGNVSSQLFVNGTYILAEDFEAGNSITTPDLEVERINCSKVPTMLQSSCTVYVDPTDPNALDVDEFEEGTVFKTLQGALIACPVMLNGQSVYIRLKSDIEEDVEFRGKTGGTVYLYMQEHDIKGTIKIWDCNSVMIYGGNSHSQTPDDMTKIPVITPKTLISYDSYYYTVLAVRTTFVYLKNVNVYGKVATTDTKYTDDTKNYAICSSRGTSLNGMYVGVGNSDNGWNAIRGGQIISQITSGLCTRYGFRANIGGQIDICSTLNAEGKKAGTATGGKVENAIGYDADTVNISTHVTFSTTELTVNTENLKPSTTSNTLTDTISSTTGYSYRTSGTYRGTWSSDNVVRQGTYTSSYGKNKGFWFFGNAFDVFKGKTITKLVLTVYRQKAGVHGSSGTMKLRFHTYKTKTAATKAVTSTESGPPVNSWNYDATVQAVYLGKTNTITLDSTNAADVLEAINKGTLKGFAIYGGTYQGYSPNMKVTVYYQ